MNARIARWSGTVFAGHKEDAVEVPFDPRERWSLASRPLRPGRRGWAVDATIGHAKAATAIVARSKRFWLLVPEAVEVAGGFAVGDVVEVRCAPTVTPSPPQPSP